MPELEVGQVELAVVKLGNRRLTIAVFKQMPIVFLADIEDDPIFQIWINGRINYHYGCDPHRGDHVHVLCEHLRPRGRSTPYHGIAYERDMCGLDWWSALYADAWSADQLYIAS